MGFNSGFKGLKKKKISKNIGIPVWESKMKIKMTLRLHVHNNWWYCRRQNSWTKWGGPMWRYMR